MWKPSKRQAQLKRRLIQSSHVYWETSRTLDQMLLKMLHNNNVYTPDDFHSRYVKASSVDKANRSSMGKPLLDNDMKSNDPNQPINNTLKRLDEVLHQLKQVIDSKNVSK